MKLRVFFLIWLNLSPTPTTWRFHIFSFLKDQGMEASSLCFHLVYRFQLAMLWSSSFFLWLKVVISFSHQSVLEHQQLLHNSLDQIDTDLMQGMEPSQI